jgi:hypothetical protein
VYESGGGAELELTTVRRAIFRAVIRCTVPDEPAAIEAYLAWMVAVVEDLRPSHASAGFAVAVPYRGDATVHDVFLNAEGIRQLGWIERLDPRVWRLPIAALTALVEEPGLRWCRAVTVRTGLLFVAAPSPHRPPSLAQQDALADGYARALFESCRELLGFHPRELFAELVVPALAARDYTPAGPPSRYVQVFANGSRRVRFHIELDLSKVGLTLRLIAEHHLDPDERYPHPAKGIAVAKPADAEAARAAFSGWPAALDALDPWFEATYEAWLTA